MRHINEIKSIVAAELEENLWKEAIRINEDIIFEKVRLGSTEEFRLSSGGDKERMVQLLKSRGIQAWHWPGSSNVWAKIR